MTRPRILSPIWVWITDWQIIPEAPAAADAAATSPTVTGQDGACPITATHTMPDIPIAAAN